MDKIKRERTNLIHEMAKRGAKEKNIEHICDSSPTFGGLMHPKWRVLWGCGKSFKRDGSRIRDGAGLLERTDMGCGVWGVRTRCREQGEGAFAYLFVCGLVSFLFHFFCVSSACISRTLMRAEGSATLSLIPHTHTQRRSSGMYPLVPLLHASCPAVSSFGKLCGKTVILACFLSYIVPLWCGTC